MVFPRSGQLCGVVPHVVLDEAGDEIVAVIVAGVPAQGQGLAGLGAGGLEPLRLQLRGQELVVQALVHQDRAAEGAASHQLAGVVFGPGAVVVAQNGRPRGAVVSARWPRSRIEVRTS